MQAQVIASTANYVLMSVTWSSKQITALTSQDDEASSSSSSFSAPKPKTQTQSPNLIYIINKLLIGGRGERRRGSPLWGSWHHQTTSWQQQSASMQDEFVANNFSLWFLPLRYFVAGAGDAGIMLLNLKGKEKWASEQGLDNGNGKRLEIETKQQETTKKKEKKASHFFLLCIPIIASSHFHLQFIIEIIDWKMIPNDEWKWNDYHSCSMKERMRRNDKKGFIHFLPSDRPDSARLFFSQPCFLAEDIDLADKMRSCLTKWDLSSPLRQFYLWAPRICNYLN